MLTKISNPITWEELTSVLEYDLDTGKFTWKEQRGSLKRGDIAGGMPKSNGYLYIGIGPKRYLAHRLAWFYCFKEWPTLDIDHINRNRSDNSLNNLREVSRAENLRNTVARSSTGYKNVYKNGDKYWARVWVNYTPNYLGTFDTVELANEAVKKYNKDNNL